MLTLRVIMPAHHILWATLNLECHGVAITGAAAWLPVETIMPCQSHRLPPTRQILYLHDFTHSSVPHSLVNKIMIGTSVVQHLGQTGNDNNLKRSTRWNCKQQNSDSWRTAHCYCHWSYDPEIIANVPRINCYSNFVSCGLGGLEFSQRLPLCMS